MNELYQFSTTWLSMKGCKIYFIAPTSRPDIIRLLNFICILLGKYTARSEYEGLSGIQMLESSITIG